MVGMGIERHLCVVAASLLLSTGVARADDDCDCEGRTAAPAAAVSPTPADTEDERGQDSWRGAFWGGLAATSGMIVGTTYSVKTVREREYRKSDLTLALIRETGDAERFRDNACDGAIGIDSALGNDLRATCDSGRRWATISNVFYAGTLVSAAFTGYAAYRAFFRRAPENPSRLRVTPRVGPGTAGATFELDF